MCNCITEFNQKLRPYNTALATDMTFNAAKHVQRVLPIPTRKLNSKDRRPALHLKSAFCPLCGEKMPDDSPLAIEPIEGQLPVEAPGGQSDGRL